MHISLSQSLKRDSSLLTTLSLQMKQSILKFLFSEGCYAVNCLLWLFLKVTQH